MVSARHSRTGMTLIELLVGMLVTALALTAGYAAFTFIIDRRAQLQHTVDPTVRAAALHRTLGAWLHDASFQIPTTVPPSTNVSLDPNSAQDVLRFTTTAATPLRTDTTTVAISVNTDALVRPRGLIALLTPSVGADSLRMALDSTVTGLRVEYLVNRGGHAEWFGTSDYVSLRSHDPAGVARGALDPRAIRVTLLLPASAAAPPVARLAIVHPFWRHP